MNDPQAGTDPRVRHLIARLERGEKVSTADAMALCPFRALFGPLEDIDYDKAPDLTVVLFGGPEQFDELRDELLEEIGIGRVVMLLMDQVELRDYVRREMDLALAQPTAGNA